MAKERVRFHRVPANAGAETKPEGNASTEGAEAGTTTPAEDPPDAGTPPAPATPPPDAKADDKTPAATTPEGNGKTAEPKAEPPPAAPAADPKADAEGAAAVEALKAGWLAEHRKAQEQYLKAEIAKWRTESEADPELGGQAYTQSMAWESSALRRFGSPQLEQMLEETGFRDNKLVRKMLRAVGKAMAPERAVFGAPAISRKPQNLHEALRGIKG